VTLGGYSGVGERYRATMDDLGQEIGWPLEVNRTPNQGAILAEARALLQAAGGQVVKGPSIFVERGEVTAALAGALGGQACADAQSAFQERTGYGLVLNWPGAATPLGEAPQEAIPSRRHRVG
jgi:hypothetical protein